ncbi:Sporulation kinase D [Moraxella caprae]|uniref:histidine kinase n=1 Tax=Moraxella caprae TaxID=90240 RepID=A0A378R2P9_9GAMM|nr:PAS domain-containing sensor histidine kinase [Moraxella caprae]STZ09596.1 Sporulation kinase D [Moraxella caprae]
MSPSPIRHTKTWVRKLWFLSANVHEEALISTMRVRQLGLTYGVYRFITACFLLMANFLLNRDKAGLPTEPTFLEQTVFSIYVVVALVLLFAFFMIKKRSRLQLLSGFVVDVVFLTLFALYGKISDFQITLLYMVVIAASYMLLSLSRATTITLMTVSALIYQQFFRFFFETPTTEKNLLTINDSLLLSVSLIAVGFLSWSISQRLAKAEQSLLDHADEVEKLHTINQAVVKNMVNGVLVLDPERNIVMINNAAQRLLHLPINDNACDSPAKIIELSRIIIKHHPKIIGWYRSLAPNQSAELIYDIPPKTHDKASMSQTHLADKLRISSKPLLEHGQILIIEDLSREQSHAQQLKLASLGQLSASIAHEIRNPLAAISQASQLLMEDVRDDDVNAEFYEMIYQQTKRVNSIISDVLSLSRQEIPNQSALDAPSWVRQFLAEHYPHEFIIVTGDTAKPILFYFDANQLEQVMTNLINNALYHTIHQFHDNDVEIRLTKTKTGAFIDILDHGEGVSEKDLASLFNPFFTTSKKGTGLGLYLSQSFSEANNAKIRYFREYDKSCFRLIVSNTPVT